MTGIERIKALSSEVKDKPLLKIIEHLLSREDMDSKYLNEEKTLKQMIEFIRSKAKKQATNGFAMIEDEEVYSWAIHYFDETNENLGLVKKEIKKEEPKKPILKTLEQSCEEVDKMVKEEEKEAKKSIKVLPEGQLSLFDLV